MCVGEMKYLISYRLHAEKKASGILCLLFFFCSFVLPTLSTASTVYNTVKFVLSTFTGRH